MKKKKLNNVHLRRAKRAHAVFFLISFGLYSVLSAIFMPSFILSDMQTKSTALAKETITIVAKVLGPPIKPIVSGSALCASGKLNVSLDWPHDENSQTFDVSRNDSTVATGLKNPHYKDESAATNRLRNTYIITAHGPMGSGIAVSEPLSLSNPEGCRPLVPFEISVSVQNPDHIVYAGNNLTVRTGFIKKSSALTNQDYAFSYTAIDADGNTLAETSEKINPFQFGSIEKNIPIPILTKAGHYTILVKTSDGENLIEGEDFFEVKEFPLVSVGTTTISLAQVMQGLSWISLLFLLLFLVLLGIEHHQSEGALIQITEDYLRRKGFLTKRKGVSR